MFDQCPQTILNAAQKEALSCGKSIPLPADAETGGMVFAFDEKDEIVAALKKRQRNISSGKGVCGITNNETH